MTDQQPEAWRRTFESVISEILCSNGQPAVEIGYEYLSRGEMRQIRDEGWVVAEVNQPDYGERDGTFEVDQT